MHARRAAAAGERQQHPADKSGAADERNRVVEQAGRGEREQGERGKPEIDRKHKQYHLNHRKTAVSRALVKMRAVRLPNPLAGD